VRAFVANVLHDEGWETTEAESAEQAFELSAEQEWAAVFCDVRLGGADGFSVLRRFKEQSPETKVVLMTGHGSAGGALDATAFGAYDYLLKPFGVEELQTLSSALQEQIASRRSSSSAKPYAQAYSPD
jgi:DNA-binding NtrC family response regulator